MGKGPKEQGQKMEVAALVISIVALLIAGLSAFCTYRQSASNLALQRLSGMERLGWAASEAQSVLAIAQLRSAGGQRVDAHDFDDAIKALMVADLDTTSPEARELRKVCGEALAAAQQDCGAVKLRQLLAGIDAPMKAYAVKLQETRNKAGGA